MVRSYFFFLFFSLVLIAGQVQAALVKGRVTDEQGQPLPFATLYLKNSTTGTATNEQGYYQLTLPAGTYEVVFQYVGYKAKVEKVEIGTSDVELNVILPLDVYSLNEIAVKANEKDPAYAIVKAAIARRRYHLQEITAYTCQVYTKGLGRLTSVPNRVLGVKINDLKTGIVYLSESVSELRFRQPNRMHERMLSSKVSGDSRGFSFNRASRFSFNFYQNLLRAPGLSERAFVSPIAANALLFYKYTLVGATQENGQYVNKIKVTPLRRNDPAFTGYIYIMEDSWRLHSLDLKLTKAHQIEYADTVRVRQSFGPVKEGVWTQLSQRITFQFDSFGFKGNGYFTTIYSRYQVQPAHPVAPEPEVPAAVNAPAPTTATPDKTALAARKKQLQKLQKAKANALFNKKQLKSEVMVIEKEANTRDSAYWAEARPIPLTEEEVKDYVVKDSIRVIQESKPYKDSLDKRHNQFEPGNLFLSGYRYRNSFKQYSIAFDPFIAVPDGPSILQYNTVEGAVLNVGVTYNKENQETNKSFTIKPTIRYGFASEKLYGQVTGNYLYNPLKFSRVTGGAGHFVSSFNQTESPPPVWNSLYTLLREQNYLKMYQKTFVTGRYNTELTNGFFVGASFEYEDRQPLTNATRFTLKNWENKQYTSNVPVNAELADASFTRNQALAVSFSMQFRPGQRYINRPNEKWVLPSKYPTFRFNYTKGLAEILGSDVDYDRLALTMSDRQELGLLGTSNYNVQVGTFLNRNQLWLMDYKHFAGNRVLYAGGFGGFQLLDYYRYSTTHRYLEAHFSHEFNGFIFNKIPVFRRLKLQEVATLNYLNTEQSKHYLEVGVGIEHIFKILRVDFITSFQSQEKVGSGIRIGFGF